MESQLNSEPVKKKLNWILKMPNMQREEEKNR